MRNMSFALTTEPMLAREKDVTRRLGWLHLKAGDMFQPVKKCMGLKAGETIQKLGPPVWTISTRREPLRHLIDDEQYGYREVRREGFRDMKPREFVTMFCDTHKGCTPGTVLSRIEFNHGPLEGWLAMPGAPKDGTLILLLLRHVNWHYAAPHEKATWEEAVRASWTNFNDGGWTWRGMCGEPIAWRPTE
jgi:hypothetical protein